MDNAHLAAGNAPRASRMAWLAFFSTTFTIACSVGSFGVLLPAVEHRLAIDRGYSSLAMGLMLICAALAAPIAGALAGRFSLRAMLLSGAFMGAAGFALLAVSHSLAAYYAAYGLLIGPAMSLNGQVLPATLVTRWYQLGRGRVLGLINVPALLVVTPIVSSFILGKYGLPAVYWMLSGAMLLCASACSLVIDKPPGFAGATAANHGKPRGGISAGQILTNLNFWVLIVPLGLLFAGSTMLSAHMVAMALTWGFSPTQAAGLMSFAPLSAMAGAPLFGWLADRIGGSVTLGLCCLATGLLWATMLLDPSYATLIGVNVLMGALAAAGMPAFGIAAADTLGAENFAQVYGLGAMIAVMFTVPIVPLAGIVFVQTGSYSAVITGLALSLTIAAAVALLLGRRKPALSIS